MRLAWNDCRCRQRHDRIADPVRRKRRQARLQNQPAKLRAVPPLSQARPCKTRVLHLMKNSRPQASNSAVESPCRIRDLSRHIIDLSSRTRYTEKRCTTLIGPAACFAPTKSHSPLCQSPPRQFNPHPRPRRVAFATPSKDLPAQSASARMPSEKGNAAIECVPSRCTNAASACIGSLWETQASTRATR